jgi:hypothetical protein
MTPERRVILLMLADVIRQRRIACELAEERYLEVDDDDTAGELREASSQLRDAADSLIEALDAFELAYAQPDTLGDPPA